MHKLSLPSILEGRLSVGPGPWFLGEVELWGGDLARGSVLQGPCNAEGVGEVLATKRDLAQIFAIAAGRDFVDQKFVCIFAGF